MLCCRPFPSIVSSPSGAAAAAPSTLYFHETEDTDWDNGDNWFTDAAGEVPWGSVPTASQDAIIVSGTCDASGTSASLVVASFGALSTNNVTVVTNNGTIYNNNGTVTINNGTVTYNESSGIIINHNSGATVGTNYGLIVNANPGSIITNTSTGTITNDFR